MHVGHVLLLFFWTIQPKVYNIDVPMFLEINQDYLTKRVSWTYLHFKEIKEFCMFIYAYIAEKGAFAINEKIALNHFYPLLWPINEPLDRCLTLLFFFSKRPLPSHLCLGSCRIRRLTHVACTSAIFTKKKNRGAMHRGVVKRSPHTK